MASDHVTFKVTGVLNDMLIVRFTCGAQTTDIPFKWDGSGDIAGPLKDLARAALMQLKRPPPPDPAKLQEQVGKEGAVDIEIVMPPVG